MDTFAYSAGNLVGKGGWTDYGLTSLVVQGAGDVAGNGTPDTFGAEHSVLSAGINVNGPYTVTLVFEFLSAGSGDSTVEVDVNEYTDGYFTSVSLNRAGPGNSVAVHLSVPSDSAAGTITLATNTPHTLTLTRTVTDAWAVKINATSVCSVGLIAIGNAPIETVGLITATGSTNNKARIHSVAISP